jgi:hypothetical protein
MKTENTGLADPWVLRDRRTRYGRRRLRHPPAHDAARPRRRPEASETPPAPPPSATDDSRVHAAHVANDAAERWLRITELNARLTETLDEEGRALWLALEQALHVHWFDVAVDHYNRGYVAGRAQRWVDAAFGDTSSVHDKLRAIALALAEVVEAFDRPKSSS